MRSVRIVRLHFLWAHGRDRNLGFSLAQYRSFLYILLEVICDQTSVTQPKRRLGVTMFVPSHFIAEFRDARKYSILSSKGWWLNRWPPLGWLETIVKVAAWYYAGRVPVPEGAGPPDLHIPQTTRLAQTWTMLMASGLLAAAIIDRLVYREIISMIFVLPNNWAHWTVVRALARASKSPFSGTDFRTFCWLMLAGDIVKLVFFAVHDFNIASVAKHVGARLSPPAKFRNAFHLSTKLGCNLHTISGLLDIVLCGLPCWL